MLTGQVTINGTTSKSMKLSNKCILAFLPEVFHIPGNNARRWKADQPATKISQETSSTDEMKHLFPYSDDEKL